MLSNKQYVQIAEKLWGWDAKAKYLNTSGLTDCPFSIWIKEEVNSWSGFGRTVEAMADMECEFSRGFVFSADCIEVEFSRCVGQKGEDDNYQPIYQSGSHLYTDIKTLIEATHLAALEAINVEKK